MEATVTRTLSEGKKRALALHNEQLHHDLSIQHLLPTPATPWLSPPLLPSYWSAPVSLHCSSGI